MGFFDKLKAAANYVTGGAAKVTIQWNPPIAFPGEPIGVRITVTSTGGPIKSDGVFVDLASHEQLNIPANTLAQYKDQLHHTKQIFKQSFQIAPAFGLGPNESLTFDGQVVIPPGAQPTYDGPFADHDWGICGRVSMSGNDPDSGFQKIVVGRKM